jgi:hypothetical protein
MSDTGEQNVPCFAKPDDWKNRETKMALFQVKFVCDEIRYPVDDIGEMRSVECFRYSEFLATRDEAERVAKNTRLMEQAYILEMGVWGEKLASAYFGTPLMAHFEDGVASARKDITFLPEWYFDENLSPMQRAFADGISTVAAAEI